ncbi:MAG: SpoIID/LytB domain-containing protein [Cellulosilyticaceae bacterium]
MIQKISIRCGALMAAVFILPVVIVFGGKFYDPILLDGVLEMKQNTSQKSMDDYREEEVISILAKSIAPESPLEAIKAQAVIVRTYMLRRELGIVEEGELVGMTEEEMRNQWKGEYSSRYALYESAAKGTAKEVIFYEDELIEPVYHKESAGATRDAINLYKVDIPYLKPVPSSYDTGSSETSISKQQFKEKIEKQYKSVLLDVTYIENQIQIVSRDESGYVQSLQVGNILMTGEEFRELLGLQSSAFTIRADGDMIVFTTKGTGHGVGMSQVGACAMAEQGKTYKEILKHYYTGTEIHKK